MPEALKVLGQLDATTTLTALYTVPGGKSATISSLVVCNRTSTNRTFQVKIVRSGDSDDVKQFLYADVTVFKNDTFIATIGLTLASGDAIKVLASADSAVTFQAFGVEVS